MTNTQSTVTTGRSDGFARPASIAARAFLLLGVALDVVACALPFLAFMPKVVFVGFGAVHVVVRLATIVTFLTWLYARLASLNQIGFSTSQNAAAAVGWFFVPVLNLYKPFLVVQALWDATDERNAGEPGISPLVLSWWIAFIGAPFAVFAMGPSLYLSPTRPGAWKVVIIASVLNVAAGILASRMIHEIERRWNARQGLLEDPDAGWELVEPVAPNLHADGPAAAPPAPEADLDRRSGFAPPDPGSSPWAKPPVPEAPRPMPLVATVTPAPSTPAPLPPTPAPEPRPDPKPTQLPPRPEVRIPAAPAPPPISEQEALESLGGLLRSTRVAAIALAVLGMISVAMMISGALYFVGVSLSADEPAVKHGAFIILLLYSGIGLLYLVPVAHQLRFAAASKRFVETGSCPLLEKALRMQGRFWAFTGGFVAILLGIQIIAMGAAILIPLMMKGIG